MKEMFALDWDSKRGRGGQIFSDGEEKKKGISFDCTGICSITTTVSSKTNGPFSNCRTSRHIIWKRLRKTFGTRIITKLFIISIDLSKVVKYLENNIFSEVSVDNMTYVTPTNAEITTKQIETYPVRDPWNFAFVTTQMCSRTHPCYVLWGSLKQLNSMWNSYLYIFANVFHADSLCRIHRSIWIIGIVAQVSTLFPNVIYTSWPEVGIQGSLLEVKDEINFLNCLQDPLDQILSIVVWL